jgi:hypothetical protein
MKKFLLFCNVLLSLLLTSATFCQAESEGYGYPYSHKSGSPFEYELVRRLYLDIREIEIAK